MKKVKYTLIGVAIGILLAFPLSATAEEILNLIGKQVQGTFPVTIDGKKIEIPAIVVDDKSFLPVRAFGEAAGFDVTFTDEREVVLNKKMPSVTDVTYTTPEVGSKTPALDAIIDKAVGRTVKSNSLGINFPDSTKMKSFELDGNRYVQLNALAKFVTYKPPYTLLFEMPHLNKIQLTVKESYETDANAFIRFDTTYVKAEAIGVKVTVYNDAIWIEKFDYQAP